MALIVDQSIFWDGCCYRGKPLAEVSDMVLAWAAHWHEPDDELAAAIGAEQERREKDRRKARRLLTRGRKRRPPEQR
jgi:hypothetical protein